MEHRHTLRFMFVRGLTTVLLPGGIGVDDEVNGLRQFTLLLHVTPFRCDRAEKEIHRSKPRTFDEQEQLTRQCFCCSSRLLKEECRACVFQVAEACRTLEPMLKPDTKWNCTGFKMVKEL